MGRSSVLFFILCPLPFRTEPRWCLEHGTMKWKVTTPFGLAGNCFFPCCLRTMPKSRLHCTGAIGTAGYQRPAEAGEEQEKGKRGKRNVQLLECLPCHWYLTAMPLGPKLQTQFPFLLTFQGSLLGAVRWRDRSHIKVGRGAQRMSRGE